MAYTAPDPERQKFSPGDVAALPFATQIDRRTCHRTVPLKVIGLGFSRTGTASLRQALIDLGYNDCYHYTTPLQENPPDAKLWVEALEAKFEGKGRPYVRQDWDQLLGHCQAVTDGPCIVFAEELLEAYPDAKVILTIREPEAWWKSAMSTIVVYWDDFLLRHSNPLVRLYRWFLPADPHLVRMTRLTWYNNRVYSALDMDSRQGTRTAIREFEAYNEEIKKLVPKEKLLIMNVKEGWEPLCRFLGKEVPLYPFPRKNDSVEFSKNINIVQDFMATTTRIRVLASAGSLLATIIAVGIAAHRYRYFSR